MKRELIQRLLCLLDHLLLIAQLLKEFRKNSKGSAHQNRYKYTCSPFRYLIASMDGISSTNVENSVQFLRLCDKYKSNLLNNSRLTKAAGLAAQKELLLESPAPDTWK